VDAEPGSGEGYQREMISSIEKVMKSVLLSKDAPVPKVHDLSRLSRKLESLGVVLSDPSLLETIQCEPSVRYDTNLTSITEAVQAHWAALDVGITLLPVLKRELE
ncbi:MAG: hypothetical protein ACOCYG_00590, partial [Spirochaetota bacterium]